MCALTCQTPSTFLTCIQVLPKQLHHCHTGNHSHYASILHLRHLYDHVSSPCFEELAARCRVEEETWSVLIVVIKAACDLTIDIKEIVAAGDGAEKVDPSLSPPLISGHSSLILEILQRKFPNFSLFAWFGRASSKGSRCQDKRNDAETTGEHA